MQYAICEIAGRQYKVVPGEALVVNNLFTKRFQDSADQKIVKSLKSSLDSKSTEDYKLAESKSLKVDKVLLMVDGDQVEVGTPYLKTVLEFEVLESVRGTKIRVAKFHAKANYRRVRGSRSRLTKIKLIDSKKPSVKKA